MLDRVALVTGAARGIGRAHAEALLNRHVKVCIGDVDVTEGRKAESELQTQYGEHNVIFTLCDVTKETDIRNMFKLTIATFGHLDIVINNAGIMDENVDMLMLEINLKGVIIGTKLALEYMGKPSGGRGGLVINMASAAGLMPQSVVPVYTATKHAVVGYSRAMGAMTPDMYGVRINCICPSYSDTDILKRVGSRIAFASKDVISYATRLVDSQELMSPDTVAACMMVLVEDDTLSGQVMFCNPEHPQALLRMPKNEREIVKMYINGKL